MRLAVKLAKLAWSFRFSERTALLDTDSSSLLSHDGPLAVYSTLRGRGNLVNRPAVVKESAGGLGHLILEVNEAMIPVLVKA